MILITVFTIVYTIFWVGSFFDEDLSLVTRSLYAMSIGVCYMAFFNIIHIFFMVIPMSFLLIVSIITLYMFQHHPEKVDAPTDKNEILVFNIFINGMAIVSLLGFGGLLWVLKF